MTAGRAAQCLKLILVFPTMLSAALGRLSAYLSPLALPAPSTRVSRARWRSERGGHGEVDSSPTATGSALDQPTTASIEAASAWCIAAIRLGTVIQMAPALSTGWSVSQRPALFASLWAFAVTASLALSVVSVVRRLMPGPTLAFFDVLMAVLLLIIGGASVPDSYLIGSWVGWFPGYAISIVISISALRNLRQWAASLLAVIVAYAFYVWPVLDSTTFTTVVGNALTYLVLGVVIRLMYGFIRKIGVQADVAMATVASLTRIEEERRARLAFHDATTVMQLLADPTLPEDARKHVQEQAGTEYQRMRAYLRGNEPVNKQLPHDPRNGAQRFLPETIGLAAAAFRDLNLTLTLDLVEHVVIDEGPATALGNALTTVLHNVRRHACATSVVIHADIADHSNEWTLTVRDDGKGFDTTSTPLGFGLAEQVHGELGRWKMSAQVTSLPDLGTMVSMSGFSAPKSPASGAFAPEKPPSDQSVNPEIVTR
ncbi:MAG: hypothetical protein ACRCTR_07770 [Actinomycetota bacterium]